MNTLFNHDQIVYSIDTSSLIDAYRRLYPMDNFPGLWQDIENLIRQDRLIMSEFVFAEAMRDQFLDDWCTDKKLKSHLELKIDDLDQIAVREILVDYPGILKVKKGKSLSDPWVIAVAKRYFQNVVIVSEEKLTGNLQHPRIPDVCKASNIECITISGMIQKEAWNILNQLILKNNTRKISIRSHIEEFGRREIQNTEIPKHLTESLNPTFELREYQKVALARFLLCFENDFTGVGEPLHFLFNMATRSDKTPGLSPIFFDFFVIVLYNLNYRLNFVE